MINRRVLALALAAVLLNACVAGAVTGAGQSPPGAIAGENEGKKTVLEEMVAAATRDLASRLGVADETIEVVEASQVTWPDSSLGCPAPGMSYLQVLTPGFLVRLRAADELHSYHAGAVGAPFLCPASRAGPPLRESPRDTR